MAVWLACALALSTLPSELETFVRKPDPSFAWHEAAKYDERAELRLTSQTWQGNVWKHDLVVMNQPDRTVVYNGKSVGTETVILYITGDRVDRADMPYIKTLAADANMRVAALFDIPNQPIFEQSEDALIALTFGKYMETGDPSWPLLFPMTKAATKAMDALQKWDPRIGKFIVVGASKRGWTTWLAAATGDKRIKGIAPMVFDFLNFDAQLKHQIASWGKYSEMLGDYVARDQPEAANTPEGKKLAAMVDPYSYRQKIAVPKLIVLGANDRYWTSDAHRLYAGGLQGRTFYRIVPNVGHDLGGGAAASASIGFFARGVAGSLEKGAQKWFDKGVVPKDLIVTWFAQSANRDFRSKQWGPKGRGPGWYASFEEWLVRSGDVKASFTSPMTVRQVR